MTNFGALGVAIEAATRKRDAARKLLLDALAAQATGQAQLNQLKSYAQEMDARWGMQSDRMVKPEVMFHHYQFMNRLGHAVGLQTGVMGQHAARVETARRQLLEAELRLNSLSRVVEMRQREQDLAAQRREQKQTDERAALRFRSFDTASE